MFSRNRTELGRQRRETGVSRVGWVGGERSGAANKVNPRLTYKGPCWVDFIYKIPATGAARPREDRRVGTGWAQLGGWTSDRGQ